MGRLKFDFHTGKNARGTTDRQAPTTNRAAHVASTTSSPETVFLKTSPILGDEYFRASLANKGQACFLRRTRRRFLFETSRKMASASCNGDGVRERTCALGRAWV